MKTSQQGLRVLSKHITQSRVHALSQGLPPQVSREGRNKITVKLCLRAGAPQPQLANTDRKDSSKAAQIKMD